MLTPIGRLLYDVEFVESNCTLPYDETTELDTTIGTYVTNYIIGGVGLICAFIIWVRKYQTPNSSMSKWLVGYFFVTGIGYALAGVGHQIIESTEDERRTLFEILSRFLVALGVLSLQASILFASKFRVALVIVMAIVLGTDMYFTTNTQMILGIYLGISFLIICIYYAWLRDMKSALGCAIIIAGLAVQLALSPLCGDSQYATCWQNCPLFPMVFNHNALFHVFVAMGLMLQASGTYPVKE